MRKKNGPNIEPCGTPARIGAQSESWPLRTTLWCLSLRKLQNRFRSFPDIPRDSSLYSNTLCDTLSNAFEIPKKLSLTSVMGYDQNLHKYCVPLILADICMSH